MKFDAANYLFYTIYNIRGKDYAENVVDSLGKFDIKMGSLKEDGTDERRIVCDDFCFSFTDSPLMVKSITFEYYGSSGVLYGQYADGSKVKFDLSFNEKHDESGISTGEKYVSINKMCYVGKEILVGGYSCARSGDVYNYYDSKTLECLYNSYHLTQEQLLELKDEDIHSLGFSADGVYKVTDSFDNDILHTLTNDELVAKITDPKNIFDENSRYYKTYIR